MSAEPAPAVEPAGAVRYDHGACSNCGTPNHGEYCSSCGQKRLHEGDLSLTHAWHHLVHETLHLDGRIVNSVKLRRRRPYLAEHIVVVLLSACVSMTVCMVLAAILPAKAVFSVWLIPSGAVSFGAAHLSRSIQVVYGASPRQTALLAGACLFASQLIVTGWVLYVQMQSIKL